MKADFYILETSSSLKAWHYACQLLEELYESGKRVYVSCGSNEEAERLDGLLWTFKDDAFIPHARYKENETHPPAVQLLAGEKPSAPYDVLVNLSNQLPDCATLFQEVIEIVFSNTTVQQLARERFRHYREQGREMTTHKLSEAEM